MTVDETIRALLRFDRSLTVYVPDPDGTAQVAKQVCLMLHTNLPIEGIVIPPDVVIVPQSLMEETTVI